MARGLHPNSLSNLIYRFPKGHTPWNKDKKCPIISEAKKGIATRGIGWHHTEETKKKMSKNSPKYWLNKKFSEEHREKIGRKSRLQGGERHWNWNFDREVVRRNLRNDGEYQQWVKAVKKRDNDICWMNDENCLGYNIVHHIKSWSKYPELRYEITNGITLCQAHHPRTRVKEKLFERLFSYLVNQK